MNKKISFILALLFLIFISHTLGNELKKGAVHQPVSGQHKTKTQMKGQSTHTKMKTKSQSTHTKSSKSH